jgi:hypothetical protein
MYVRIVMEDGQQTLAYCHDLGKKNTPQECFDFAVSAKDNTEGVDTWLYQNQDTYNTGKLSQEEIAKFLAPGSVLYVFPKGDTDNIYPKKWITDGNNIPVAREVITVGNGNRVEELNGLFLND